MIKHHEKKIVYEGKDKVEILIIRKIKFKML